MALFCAQRMEGTGSKEKKVNDRKRKTGMARANEVYHTIDSGILFSLMDFKSLTLPAVRKKGISLLWVYTHNVHTTMVVT